MATYQAHRARLAALLVPIALAGCGETAPPSGTAATLRVTTTIGMITDAVREVGGDRVTVTGLMGPGVDPHLYKPTADDVRALSEADLILYNGLHLEGRMTELFERVAEDGTPTVAVTRDIPPDALLQSTDYENAPDPHVWFDVALWQTAVLTIAAALAEHDPDAATTYAANRDRYLAELDALDAWVVEQTATVPPVQRVLVTAHDAFGYFGARYDFEVRGVQGISTAAEASPSDIRALAELITERQLKALFVESSVPPTTIEAVQAAVASRGWEVAIGPPLFSDALGAPDTPPGTYDGMVRHNVTSIVESLR